MGSTDGLILIGFLCEWKSCFELKIYVRVAYSVYFLFRYEIKTVNIYIVQRIFHLLFSDKVKLKCHPSVLLLPLFQH